MKRIVIICLGFLTLILIVCGVLYFLKIGQSSSVTATSTNPFEFSSGTSLATSSSSGTVTLQLKDGSTAGVQNFVPASQPDGASPTNGLQLTQDETTEYTILYYPNNSGFLISLTEEPLAKSRSDAEKFLQTKLTLTQAQFCKLQVQVFTSVDVNETYAGQDLGISFCPNSVRLPS